MPLDPVPSHTHGGVLPDDVTACLPPAFSSGFMGDPGFVGLGPRLVRTSNVLRTRYAPPRLSVERTPGGNLLCMLNFDGAGANVCAVVTDRDTNELYPPATLYGALPTIFQSYFSWLEALQYLAPGEQPSLAWHDLPCAYNGRRELLGLASHSKRLAEEIKRVYLRLDSKSLQAWITGSEGDIFFADEYNQRGQLFHLHAARPAEVSRVHDEEFLDDYVAFVLAGNLPSTFDISSRATPLDV